MDNTKARGQESTRVRETQVLEPQPAPFRVHVSRKLEQIQDSNPDTPKKERGIPSGIFTVLPNAHPFNS